MSARNFSSIMLRRLVCLEAGLSVFKAHSGLSFSSSAAFAAEADPPKLSFMLPGVAKSIMMRLGCNKVSLASSELNLVAGYSFPLAATHQ